MVGRVHRKDVDSIFSAGRVEERAPRRSLMKSLVQCTIPPSRKNLRTRKKRGNVLRFCGSADLRTMELKVELMEFPMSHAFANLQRKSKRRRD